MLFMVYEKKTNDSRATVPQDQMRRAAATSVTHCVTVAHSWQRYSRQQCYARTIGDLELAVDYTLVNLTPICPHLPALSWLSSGGAIISLPTRIVTPSLRRRKVVGRDQPVSHAFRTVSSDFTPIPSPLQTLLSSNNVSRHGSPF